MERQKQYDLEERTFVFAKDCRSLVKNLPKYRQNVIDGDQLIRASGSTAANYIEANEAISKKDFSHRIKICRKEVKESRLWLRLLDVENRLILEKERQRLIVEAVELGKIFGAILEKCK